MSVAGHIYGVVLNDTEELERLAPEFATKPYLAPPKAPVVYMKPRSSLANGAISHDANELVCAPTLALLLSRDATCRSIDDALECVGAVAVAIDVSLPEASYYRPAVGQRNADAFLVLGEWQVPSFPDAFTSFVDDVQVHQWSLERLVRSPATLLAELSSFMTLRAGDVLLVGLPGDAPRVSAAHSIRVEAAGLPNLEVSIGKKTQ